VEEDLILDKTVAVTADLTDLAAALLQTTNWLVDSLRNLHHLEVANILLDLGHSSHTFRQKPIGPRVEHHVKAHSIANGELAQVATVKLRTVKVELLALEVNKTAVLLVKERVNQSLLVGLDFLDKVGRGRRGAVNEMGGADFGLLHRWRVDVGGEGVGGGLIEEDFAHFEIGVGILGIYKKYCR